MAQGTIAKTDWNPFSVLFLAVGFIGIGGIGFQYLRFNNCMNTCAEAAQECIARVERGEVGAEPAKAAPASGSALPSASKASTAPPEVSAMPQTPEEIKTREITRCRSVQESCGKHCNPMSALAPGQ